jgi:LAO/AO transport system kinase
MNEKRLASWLESRKNRKEESTAPQLLSGILKGEIRALSSAITLLESARLEDKNEAKILVQQALPHAGKSIRIGITGVPGVGKSTFIEAFGMELIRQGKKVAILAIDPSSEKSGGSILGDKTRMHQLSMEKNAFIRPTPSGNSLGGVARKSRETILLCEAAGFDVILVETVGVGQSETMVHSMVDFFLLLMLAGAGDELQGIKRGIMEMADALVITKADGDNIRKANAARQEYQNAMHLFPPTQNGWIPKAMTCSALEGNSIDFIAKTIDEFVEKTTENGFFQYRRHEQDRHWMLEALKELILSDFFDNELIQSHVKSAQNAVELGEITSFDAADQIYNQFKNKQK